MGHAWDAPLEGEPRVLVAEGSELIRRGVCDALRSAEPAPTVAEAGRFDELRDLCREFRPDVLFLGSISSEIGQTTGRSRLVALRQALRLVPQARVVVLVERPAPEELVELLQQRASGVLTLEASARSLRTAVVDVLAGGTVIDPQLFRALFEHLLQANAGTAQTERGMQPAMLRLLSPREQEVLAAVVEGKRNKEIARELGVSVGTVKTHLRHIFRKLTVDDRVTAILAALDARPSAAA